MAESEAPVEETPEATETTVADAAQIFADEIEDERGTEPPEPEVESEPEGDDGHAEDQPSSEKPEETKDTGESDDTPPDPETSKAPELLFVKDGEDDLRSTILDNFTPDQIETLNKRTMLQSRFSQLRAEEKPIAEQAKADTADATRWRSLVAEDGFRRFALDYLDGKTTLPGEYGGQDTAAPTEIQRPDPETATAAEIMDYAEARIAAAETKADNAKAEALREFEQRSSAPQKHVGALEAAASEWAADNGVEPEQMIEAAKAVEKSYGLEMQPAEFARLVAEKHERLEIIRERDSAKSALEELKKSKGDTQRKGRRAGAASPRGGGGTGNPKSPPGSKKEISVADAGAAFAKAIGR